MTLVYLSELLLFSDIEVSALYVIVPPATAPATPLAAAIAGLAGIPAAMPTPAPILQLIPVETFIR